MAVTFRNFQKQPFTIAFLFYLWMSRAHLVQRREGPFPYTHITVREAGTQQVKATGLGDTATGVDKSSPGLAPKFTNRVT